MAERTIDAQRASATVPRDTVQLYKQLAEAVRFEPYPFEDASLSLSHYLDFMDLLQVIMSAWPHDRSGTV